jgi:D-serine deaminase-like pyridoxal phosphate-dependent protein
MNIQRALRAADPFVTPIAVVDVETMEANLTRMASLAREAGLRLRPHAKTHKTPGVGLRQIAQGAAGLTVATLKEAEIFADAGVEDLLLAHPPAGEQKLRRLNALAERVPRLAVAFDDVSLAETVPEAVDILWEVDTGHHRIGTPPGEMTVRAVAELVGRVGERRFRGLLTFPGHAYGAADRGERRSAAKSEASGLVDSSLALRKRGIEARELSAGSTPTAEFAREFSGLTEIRPGNYVYGDANQVALGSQPIEDCALAVIATVVSVPAADRAVLDCGSKAISADMGVPGLAGHGMVLGVPGARIARLSEEHAVLVGERMPLRTGDRVAVLPAHACTTVNLYPAILFVEPSGGRKMGGRCGQGLAGLGRPGTFPGPVRPKGK